MSSSSSDQQLLLSLPDLASDLQRPFPLEVLILEPFGVPQHQQSQVRLVAPVQAYIDRLNQLVYGQWDTPAPTPGICIAGSRLIVCVTLMICGVVRTAYAEGTMESTHDQPVLVDSIYAQAFRTACAQFGFGRYLLDVPTTWQPYDPTTRSLLLSADEQRALVRRIYDEAGLLAQEDIRDEVDTLLDEVEPPDLARLSTAQAQVDPRVTDWILRAIHSDPRKIQSICTRYKVERIEQLTNKQAVHLINYIEELQRTQSPKLAPPTTTRK